MGKGVASYDHLHCSIVQVRSRDKDDGSSDIGLAVVTASDRMFTDSGLQVQYESGQGKFGIFRNRVVILVADSIPVQSEIISRVGKLVQDSQLATVRDIAECYAQQVVAFKRDEAERLYLSPYGMTMDHFSEVMKNSNSSLMQELAQNILDYTLSVEAIVAGVSDLDEAYLYHIDGRGIITSHTDLGFVSIGSGHYHSNSYLTAHSYWNGWIYRNAIGAIYSAKKQAEAAPGVGKLTDMLLVTRSGAEAVHQYTMKALEAEYPAYRRAVGKLEERMMKRTWDRIIKSHDVDSATTVQSQNVKNLSKSAGSQHTA
jgi:20S proteasome alpha/beta subunit